ncbi:MAG: bifunctional phosphoribosylaminoimidazolecarboxamide formyltransferase/IMP cyclohydrolase [Schleiferiaceae bacterium]|nr:bifunctional phosphoribosylaminoimidazolecarboxamide formyltransferase/IMP cyclohydrolase [Schleiferiaceae bacterium]
MSQAVQAPFALLSVFQKEGLPSFAQALVDQGYRLLSTGGTQRFLQEQGFQVEKVEDLTGYPSILDGRVKTLHPKVFGGILAQPDQDHHQAEMQEYQLQGIGVVVVDLYPFEETRASGAAHAEIIEKIDIGGIALLRAAAKNYQHTWVISSRSQYKAAQHLLAQGGPTEEQRRRFAGQAFRTSAFYDAAIGGYLAQEDFMLGLPAKRELRYGENPHQKGVFRGDLSAVFDQLHGKELSYNNLLDADAALKLIREFEETTVAVLKHNNACGLASRPKLLEAWQDALAGDPTSAFGGVLIANAEIDAATAEAMNEIFFEIVIAPGYQPEALQVLQQKKNRIILRLKDFELPKQQYRSVLNGFLVQDQDNATDQRQDEQTVTQRPPSEREWEDLLFASKICKHTKSNTIVLARDKQLLGSGTGQTSRVDACHQAIEKAQRFALPLEGGVMASDAFFPFPDCVEIAHQAGIEAVIQPGGSIRDKQSIAYCDQHQMAMVATGTRHFKH